MNGCPFVNDHFNTGYKLDCTLYTLYVHVCLCVWVYEKEEVPV